MTPPTTRTVLAASAVALVASTEAALLFAPVPQPAHDIVQVIVGALIAKFGTVYDFYFGGSKASREGDGGGQP